MTSGSMKKPKKSNSTPVNVKSELLPGVKYAQLYSSPDPERVGMQFNQFPLKEMLTAMAASPGKPTTSKVALKRQPSSITVEAIARAAAARLNVLIIAPSLGRDRRDNSRHDCSTARGLGKGLGR